MRTVSLLAGVAIALLAAAAPVRAQAPADFAPRTNKLVSGSAQVDPDKPVSVSKREVNRRLMRPSEEFKPPTPSLAPPPPLTIEVAPIPLPDPRPRVMFNKDFPSLKFQREEEYGFKFNERGG